MGKNLKNILRNNEDYFDSKRFFDNKQYFPFKFNKYRYEFKISRMRFWKWFYKFIEYYVGKHIDEFYANYRYKLKGIINDYRTKYNYILDEFKDSRFSCYYLENGIIKKKKIKPKIYYIKSIDYKEIWTSTKINLIFNSYYDIPYSIRDKYKLKIVSGKVYKFNSKNNPLYKKIIIDKKKIHDQKKKKELELRKLKTYSFISKKEMEEKENQIRENRRIYFISLLNFSIPNLDN